ncbi:MAG: hypothetical protein ABJO01_06480 [Parasphingorhabdus sp.]|uniref:hypothetical protein n=1 Tax=Parasphingorhabdus sp. TaxID=2709688 RepID=UPI003299B9E6
MAKPVWLPVILCLFLIGQIVAGNHFHEMETDGSTEPECVICAQAGKSDDLDIPSVIGAPNPDFLNLWQTELATAQPSIAALEEKARAPPHC